MDSMPSSSLLSSKRLLPSLRSATRFVSLSFLTFSKEGRGVAGGHGDYGAKKGQASRYFSKTHRSHVKQGYVGGQGAKGGYRGGKKGGVGYLEAAK